MLIYTVVSLEQAVNKFNIIFFCENIILTIPCPWVPGTEKNLFRKKKNKTFFGFMPIPIPVLYSKCCRRIRTKKIIITNHVDFVSRCFYYFSAVRCIENKKPEIIKNKIHIAAKCTKISRKLIAANANN